jgi:hypothetical protein
MPIKVENRSNVPVKDLEQQINEAFDILPAEHRRGFGRIVVVDRIEDPRLTKEQTENLPLLYRPKMPGLATAFGEIAMGVLRPSDASLLKRIAAKSQGKALIAQSVISLVAQHYYFTLSSRKKKGPEIERAVREYVEKYFKVWRDRQGGLRARIFKPLIPYLERWQKSARKYQIEQAHKKRAADGTRSK